MKKTGKRNELTDTKNDYIDSIDSKNGTVTLKANPLKNDDGTPLESFSAFSLTSGNNAIKTEGDKVTISYHPDVHLVKIHTFYVNDSMRVVGSGEDEKVFGSGDTQEDDEQDVAWVYTYIKESEGHHVGEIVKGENDKPVYDKKDLPTDCRDGEDVKLTKVYSTLEGLHTDKTANSVKGNDREFTIDLETWYSGAKAADVGLVLDASGSMIFTSDALEPIHLDEKEIEEFELKDKMLSKKGYEGKDTPSTNAWNHDIFLTQEEVNKILNVHNTDNNPLGNSGYNYYVFNESEDVNEYAPLGYWDGSLNDELYDSVIGYYEFNKGKYENTKNTDRRDWLKNSANGNSASVVKQIDSGDFESKKEIKFEEANSPTQWSGDNRIKMNDKGLTVKDLDKDKNEIESLGVLLDVQPTTNDFTISFTVEKNGNESKNPEKEADLIYIGPLENIDSSDYYRVYRDENGSRNRLKVKDNSKKDEVSINNIFNKIENKTCTITLVFKDGEIETYKDGTTISNDAQNTQKINLTERNIVLTGFDNDYDGADLYIDNVCVFDTALSADDVKRISFTEKEAKEKEYLAYNTFEEDEETDKLVKAGETAENGETVINGEEKIAFTNKYFVDPVTGGMSGWYYINHDSNLEEHYFNTKIETGKVLWGVNNVEEKDPATYTDKFETPTDVTAKHENTEFTYKPDGNSPTLFYIDEEGYLCCFFTRGTKKDQVGASFVYEKDDSKYIKAEALQRALGSFASELNEASPYSEISAVRYSSDKAKEGEYNKFVLLDWTNDPSDVQDMMSLSYGNGGTTTGTDSSHKREDGKTITQYNYGVTGGTATYVGLEAFEQFLAKEANKEADKYLIIFTDGKDTSGEEKQTEITKTIQELKEQGYTIMAVMLTGGSIEYSDEKDSEYQTAKKFLMGLVGNSESESLKEEDKEQFFFSTAEIKNSDEEKDDKEEADTIDRLTEIFTNDILERISDNLESYSVQDYIDPRFNLVSADDKEYKLDANGIVTIINKDGTTYAKYNLKDGTMDEPKEGVTELIKEDNKNYLSVKISNDSDVDIDTRKARLYFDDSNNMYYLKWVKQTIPGCVVDAKILPVWNTRFTIKAKDDVLGGNAILTNGNAEKMNYVYSENDKEASSGTDKCKGKDDASVSKGFPRVTVNIPTYEIEKESKQTIYMGESLDYKTIEREMIKQVNEDSEKENIKYFWEYLERYAKNENNSEKNYIEELLKNKTITIPYYYLPNKDKTNLAENKTEHKQDKLGTLVYKIEENGGKDGEIQDKKERKLELTVTYKPATIDDRLKENEKLVTESAYEWDEKYKPVVGNEQSQKEVIKNEHKIDIVSGEIALQVTFDSKVVEVMENEEIEYDVDLYRTYNGETKKVGTFKAKYKKDNDDKPDKEGNITVTAEIEYLEDYMKKNGLPLGTYTLGNPKIVKAPSYMKFDTTNVVQEVERYVKELFTLGTDNDKPEKYLAKFENNSAIILGDKENDTDKTNGYLEKRFGLFEVKPIVVFEMPLAGSNSLMMIYIVAVGCIVTATILHKSIRLRIKKRKKVYKK